MRFSKLSLLIVGLSCAVLLQGCTAAGIATGTGAVMGVSAAKEGGLKQSAKDFWISTQVKDLWFRYNVETFSKLDVTVQQGRVLVTGVVQDPEHRVEAIRIAWQPSGVKQVINEVRVAESTGVSGFLTDKWITTQIRAKITIDKEVQSINHSIDTVQGTVYLMGVAHSQNEINRVVDIARNVSNVQQVISYIRLVEEVPGSFPSSSQETAAGTAQSQFQTENASGAPTSITSVEQEKL